MGFDDKIFQDETCWDRYTCEEYGDICVYNRCHCGRYLKKGKVYPNSVIGFKCKIHGEVEPFWMRD